MLVKLQCPQCGAPMEIDDQQEQVFCKFCGTRIANLKEKVEVTQNVNVTGTVLHVMDRSNEPNLYISYATANPSVVMVVRIVDTGTKNTYFNGQTQTYHLSQGRHEIVLKIGRKNYGRTIFIPADNAPVRINAAYNGRHAEITIDQPSFTNEINIDRSFPVQPTQTAKMDNNPPVQTANVDMNPAVQTAKKDKKPQSVFSIIAFILSMTIYGAVIGVPLAIYDLVRGKNDKEHSHGLAIAGLIIGTIVLIVMVPNWLGLRKDSSSSNGSSNSTEIIDRTSSSDTEETDNPSGEKNEKNGFDEKTNRICQYGAYSFQVPDYYYEKEKTEKRIELWTSSKNADAIIYFNCIAVGGSQAEYDLNRDNISNELLNIFSEANTLEKESITVSGLSGTILRGVCKVKRLDDSFIIAHMYDSVRKNILSFVFIQKIEYEVDYSSDAEKIIRSLKVDPSVTNAPSSTDNSGNNNGIRPEFQKMMDDYLQFFKEYCDFIKSYSTSPDASMLIQYYSMLTQYEKAMAELEGIDEGELSQEELELYLDTMNKINKMLIGLAGTP